MIEDIDAAAFQIRLPWYDRVLLAAAIVVVGYCYWAARRDLKTIGLIAEDLKAGALPGEPAERPAIKTPVM